MSRHNLCSNWCSLKLRLATLRLLVEHRNILILVFLEDIPFSHWQDWSSRLARLVKTRTYLDWPQDSALQPPFWTECRPNWLLQGLCEQPGIKSRLSELLKTVLAH